jgi:CheY-like chemotaxis protein
MTPSPDAEPDTRAAVRVLLVDDNVDTLESMQILLQALGYEVAIARDAGEALAHAGTFGATVAIVDIGLPGTTGYELAPALREASPAPLRLVAFTGYSTDDALAQAREAGFDTHLVKPVALDSLLAALGG